MVRLPQTGSAFCGLNERTQEIDQMIRALELQERTPKLEEMIRAANSIFETSIVGIIADLGLKPLSVDVENFIREGLGEVIGLWSINHKGRLLVKDRRSTLTKIAHSLDQLAAGRLNADLESEIVPALSGHETGLRQSHDIAVAGKIIETLSHELGYRTAFERVHNFRNWPQTVAEACRRADKSLSLLKGKAGRPTLNWYRAFKDVLVFVADRNGIPLAITIDPQTGRATGRFIKLAMEFERLLPAAMRSSSPETCAGRLKSDR
jgi:hypothetical protein